MRYLNRQILAAPLNEPRIVDTTSRPDTWMKYSNEDCIPVLQYVTTRVSAADTRPALLDISRRAVVTRE